MNPGNRCWWSSLLAGSVGVKIWSSQELAIHSRRRGLPCLLGRGRGHFIGLQSQANYGSCGYNRKGERSQVPTPTKSSRRNLSDMRFIQGLFLKQPQARYSNWSNMLLSHIWLKRISDFVLARHLNQALTVISYLHMYIYICIFVCV